jgi:Leucine-rich repeat (LRR) protein
MLGNQLPSNIGDAFPNLNTLFLGNNSFEGHIPASLGNASLLQNVSLANNKLIGKIPSSFGKLSGLLLLDIAVNMLEARDTEGWEFLHALANCRSLKTLLLPNNNLQGAIPDSIGNLITNLAFLMLGGNQLSGVVPKSIVQLNGLKGLTLDANNLTGTIE